MTLNQKLAAKARHNKFIKIDSRDDPTRRKDYRAFTLGNEGVADGCCPACGQKVDIEERGIRLVGDTLIWGKKFVAMEPKPAQLLARMLKEGGTVLTKQRCMDELYGDDPSGGPEDYKIVDIFVCKIRKALAKGGMPLEILTWWGRGYSVRVIEDAQQ